MHLTDRRTEFSSLDHICIACSAVRIHCLVMFDVYSVRKAVNVANQLLALRGRLSV